MLKSKIDGDIVDLIMEHYNKQSLNDEEESLSGDEFMRFVRIAEYFDEKRAKLIAGKTEDELSEAISKYYNTNKGTKNGKTN